MVVVAIAFVAIDTILYYGGWEAVQLIKYSPQKHEDLSSNPQNPHKARYESVYL